MCIRHLLFLHWGRIGVARKFLRGISLRNNLVKLCFRPRKEGPQASISRLLGGVEIWDRNLPVILVKSTLGDIKGAPDEECEVEGGGDAAGGTAVAVAIWEPSDIGSDIPAVPEIDLRETEAQRSLRLTAEQLAWKLYDDAPPPPQFTENILQAARREKARVLAAAIKLNAEWI